MERTEGFVGFSLMIIFPQYVSYIAVVVASLIVFTGLQRFNEARKNIIGLGEKMRPEFIVMAVYWAFGIWIYSIGLKGKRGELKTNGAHVITVFPSKKN